MDMQPDEIVFYERKAYGVIVVLAKMSGWAKEWPDTYNHNGVLAKFAGQTFIPRSVGGGYSGCAEYVVFEGD